MLPVVAEGLASERDALLVTEITGRPLGSMDPEQIGDGLLEDIWRLAERLHELGIAHGRLTSHRIIVRPDGSPALGDFGASEVTASDADLMADRAQLLVTTALATDPERAVSVAIAALDMTGGPGPTGSR